MRPSNCTHDVQPLVELKLVACWGSAIPGRIGNPSVKLGLLPAAAADAELDLLRKRAFVHFAINSRTGQAGAVEDGLEADDAVWFGHGRVSIH